MHFDETCDVIVVGFGHAGGIAALTHRSTEMKASSESAASKAPGASGRALPRSFYDRDPVVVATELLGKHLVHAAGGIECVGRIVEVEAYLGPHDLAAHSARGLTPRTRIMFGPPGHAYIYLIYGMYHCMNVVTQQEGTASAVLLRALEPVKNIEGRTQGPGLLCKAMHIDKRLNGHDLLSDDFYIAEEERPARHRIVKRPRVGVEYAGHWAKRLLRFYIRGNPHISRP